VIEHVEKQFQKNFVPGKSLQVMNQQMGSSAKLFSKLIIQKNQRSGIRLFVLADSDAGYVHSVIQN
jgi:hypothetical protein